MGYGVRVMPVGCWIWHGARLWGQGDAHGVLDVGMVLVGCWAMGSG